MTIGTEAGSTYVLGTTQREYERVRRQAEVWQHATERVLDRVDPAPGSRVLDAGSGPGVTMRQLAQRVGKDRSTIANSLRLLRLPRPIQNDLRAGRLTMGHARALLSLTDPAEQLKLRDEILKHEWSVRTTEEGVERRRLVPPVARRRSPELVALEQDPWPPQSELARADLTRPVDVESRHRRAADSHHRTLAIAHIDARQGGIPPHRRPRLGALG